MAEDKKIVTKKTAAKPAATTKTPPARAAAESGKAPVTSTPGTKKTATRAATPKPTAVSAAPAAKPAPGPRPAPIPKPAVKAPAAPGSTMPSATPAQKTPARKVAAKKAPAAAASATGPSPQPPVEEKAMSLQHLAKVTAEERLAMISEAAYYKAEKRQFAPGHEAEDWAAAEREIDELLAKAQKIYRA